MEQYDLTCEPKWKIGLLGSVYFAGVLSTVIFVPMLADAYGRKWNAFISYVVFIVSVILILLMSDLMVLYVLLFIAGSTFGGRAIVNFNYVVEFIHERRKQLVVFLKLLWASLFIILFTAEFQFMTKSYYLVASIFLVCCIGGTIYVFVAVPESPVFYYNEERYDDARDSLEDMADFNSVYKIKNYGYYGYFRFVKEEQLKDLNDRVRAIARVSQGSSADPREMSGSNLMERHERQILIEEYKAIQEDYIARENYVIDVVRLTIMWSSATFCSYTLTYLNKYLSGSIYINYYFDGASGVIAYFLGVPLYSYCKVKISFLTALSVAFLGSIGIYMFEAGIISPYFIDGSCAPSGYPPDSAKDREYHLAKIIPVFTFTSKIGNFLLFYCCY